MIELLRSIIQEVNAARDLDEVLNIIVRRVKEAMVVDAASISLADFERQEIVLMVSDGLQLAAPGAVRVNFEEGLIGLVARRAEPVNVADAATHPHFKNVPEMGEERLHAFLGAPIIHQRKVLGVLVVQREEQRRFSEESVAFLVTLAAQLAGAIAHAEASGMDNHIAQILHSPQEHFISGVAGSPGVAIGTAVVIYAPADLGAVPDRTVEDVEHEVQVFEHALACVREEVRAMGERLSQVLNAEDGALFDVYTLLLHSDSLVAGVMERIRKGNWAPAAVRDVVNAQARVFEDMEDAYLRERSQDIREIGRRLLMQLQQTNPVQARAYPEHAILVGEAIGATELAEACTRGVAGVISSTGSSSSHVAILARAIGIPAVMGASDITTTRMDGAQLIVDGYQGRIYLQPSPAIQREYARLAREESRLSDDLQALRDQPSVTSDGVAVPLYVNTGLLADIRPSLESGAEGIGLYRTEFPFMIRERFPGEEEQYHIYRQVLSAFHPRPVVLRSLDVGGDKALPYFPIVEDNPFLGWRGMRITLDHPEIFLTQVRAMLRAAAGLENLYLLLPMISDVSELVEATALLMQACTELEEEGENVVWPKLGVMVEVPSAVYQAGRLAELVDFVSIGTNDLTQYLLAVDRNNARVAKLYNTLHPAVLQAVQQVITATRAHGRPVSVCGEMAGDPGAAILLLGMGVDSLSMAAASLPRIKWVVRSFSRAQAAEILAECLELGNADEIRLRVTQALDHAGLGGLVRAGR